MRRFQCSSASRKFLNPDGEGRRVFVFLVSVLFSEPKIPQFTVADYEFSTSDEFQCSSASRKFLNLSSPLRLRPPSRVSVLFSEPKIPQSSVLFYATINEYKFQCSSASRKFLNTDRAGGGAVGAEFQCSSASRKFLNYRRAAPYCCCVSGFSALQRAENSSIILARAGTQ